MNFKILAQETVTEYDITNYVISYTRNHNLCNATGILELILADTFDSISFIPYTTIKLYEDDILKGTYFVSSKDVEKPAHTITLACEAITKRLTDYWISESLYTTTPTTFTRYWIETILDLTGVSYSFTTSSQGELVQEDTEMGYIDAKSILTKLLSQSGWYLTFTTSGELVIGKIPVESEPSLFLEDTEILELVINESDKMYRNRTVVWGKTNPVTKRWIFSDKYRPTSYDYDSNDRRTIVYANHLISEQATSDAIAKRLLDEFATEDIETVVSVAGFLDIDLAQLVFVNSAYHVRRGMVTELQVNVDSSGAITTLTLDQKCPRIVGGFDPDGYVYIGTEEDGVWRKPLKYIHTWTDFSQGLDDLDVSDLSIANGVFATVAGEKLYYRYEGNASWDLVDIPQLSTSGYIFPTASSVARACSVNQVDSDLYGILNIAGSLYYASGFLQWQDPFRSWLIKQQAGICNAIPIHISSGDYQYDFLGIDVEANGSDVILSTLSKLTNPDGPVSEIAGYSRGNRTLNESSFYPLSDEDFSSIVSGAFNEPISRTNLNTYLGDIFYNNYHFFTNTADKGTVYRYNLVTETADSILMSVGITSAVFAGISESKLAAFYSNSGVLLDFDTDTKTTLFTSTNIVERHILTKITGGIVYVIFLWVEGASHDYDVFYRVYNATAGTISDAVEITELQNSYNVNINTSDFTGNKMFVIFKLSLTASSFAYRNGLIDLVNRTYTISDQTNISGGGYYDLLSQLILVNYDDSTVSIYRSFQAGIKKVTINSSLVETETSTTLPTPTGFFYFTHGKHSTYVSLNTGTEQRVYDFPSESLRFTLSGTDNIVAQTSDDTDGAIFLVKSDSKTVITKKLPDGTETTIYTADADLTSLELHGRKFIATKTGFIYIFFDNAPDEEPTLPYSPFIVGNTILKYDGNIFTSIYNAYDDTKVEISKATPIVLYGGVNNSGILPSGATITNLGYLNLSPYTDPFDFRLFSLIGRTPNFNYEITDARIFDLAVSSGVSRCVAICQNNTISGYTALGLIDTNYIMNGRATYITESGVLLYSGIPVVENYAYQYLDISRWYDFPGIITNFETSNYSDIPYMFVGIQTTASGVDFYQKDAYSKTDTTISGFIQRIDNIPDSFITCIRVDDSL